MNLLKPLVASLLLGLATPALAAPAVSVEFELPLIANGEAHRPFVAVWVEQSGKPVRSLALWMDDNEWEVDLRRWWRKAGRYGHQQLDAVTSATRSAGRYQLSWDGHNASGQPVAAGEYLLVLEAVREDGNRTLLKQPFNLGGEAQHFSLPAGQEIGPVTLTVGVSQ